MFLKYVCWKLDNRLLLRSSWNFDRSSCGQKSFYHSNDTNKSQTKKIVNACAAFLVHAMHRGASPFGPFINMYRPGKPIRAGREGLELDI